MKFAGIIAEYDPFHNGHAWQLQAARALGAQYVAVVMSCGLTQRGAPPLLPETVRGKAALNAGADFVFALPAPYACAGAEAFARAGVHLLSAAGCDGLVFGAESPDAKLFMDAAKLLCSEQYCHALKAELNGGAKNFAAARQAAVRTLCVNSALADLLDKPNNNLGVEYCKAILEQSAGLEPCPMPRLGAGHGQALDETQECYASASALRTLWEQGDISTIAQYVPSKAMELYAEAFEAGRYTDFAASGHSELSLLRAKAVDPKAFCNIRCVSEGLEHRLYNAVRESTSLPELLDKLTTVRYPRARMRRLAMDAALGFEADALPALPPYLHLLGAKKDALPLLKNASLPVSHSLAKLANTSDECAAVAHAQAAASDFTAFQRKKPEAMGSIYRQKIIFST